LLLVATVTGFLFCLDWRHFVVLSQLVMLCLTVKLATVK